MAVNQLKAGVALNYIVIILGIFVGLIYTPYMLRMMGQSEYGLYSLVASVIAYLTVLDLGFGNAVVRYTAKFRAENKLKEQYEMFGMFFMLYIAISVIILFAGAGIYYNVETMFGQTMTQVELSKARIMILIMVFNLAFTFPMSLFGSIITAYERFVFPKVVGIIRTVLNTIVMVILLYLGYKAIAMVVVLTVFNVSTLIINYIYCKKELNIQLIFGKFQWGFLKEVAIYSFWIFLNIIMDRIYWSTGQFVLGVVSGTIAIAVYSVAIGLQHMYMQFSTAIASVFLPKVTKLVALNDNNKEISDLFIRTGRIQNIIMSLLLFGFIAFGRQFITLWAGNNYSDAFIMTLLFFVSLYVPLIQNLGITILQARNQMKFRSLLYIAIASVALVLQYFFSILWGGIGCAIAVSGALFIGQGLIMNVYYYKYQKIEIFSFWKEIIKMDIAPIVVTTLTILILSNYAIDTWMKLIFVITAYLIVYCITFYYFSMNFSEKQLITKPIVNFLLHDRH